MKPVIFINVLYFILIRTFVVKGAAKCGSKVELRAVLLSCPTKESGCEDEDPLTQVMNAEEAQILQTNGKSFDALGEEKRKAFPSAVKDCKRKIIITLKVKNSGKIPCDDEYIVVDHVFDPVTGGKGRLLSPVVLKLRQEQMVHLYKLQYQRSVNGDPFEEQKKGENVCSVSPESSTCGIALYNGKPIPFSEGFCCSCNSYENTKREIPSEFHKDSFLSWDSKELTPGNSRIVRDKKFSAILNPRLVELRSDPGYKPEDYKDDTKSDGCMIKELCLEKLPNYLLENDRKIICDKGDFINELCKLSFDREKSNAENAEPSDNETTEATETTEGPKGNETSTITSYRQSRNSLRGINEIRGIHSFKILRDLETRANSQRNQRIIDNLSFQKMQGLQRMQDTQSSRSSGTLQLLNKISDQSKISSDENLIKKNQNLLNKNALKNILIHQKLAGSLDQSTRADSLFNSELLQNSYSVKSHQGIRGKRENREVPKSLKSEKKLALEEKLEKFARSKHHLKQRRKRLLELSHKRLKKEETPAPDVKVICPTEPTTEAVSEDILKASPPKYFFSHDKVIIDPLEPNRITANVTCLYPVLSEDEPDQEEQTPCDSNGLEKQTEKCTTEKPECNDYENTQQKCGKKNKSEKQKNKGNEKEKKKNKENKENTETKVKVHTYEPVCHERHMVKSKKKCKFKKDKDKDKDKEKGSQCQKSKLEKNEMDCCGKKNTDEKYGKNNCNKDRTGNVKNEMEERNNYEIEKQKSFLKNENFKILHRKENFEKTADIRNFLMANSPEKLKQQLKYQKNAEASLIKEFRKNEYKGARFKDQSQKKLPAREENVEAEDLQNDKEKSQDLLLLSNRNPEILLEGITNNVDKAFKIINDKEDLELNNQKVKANEKVAEDETIQAEPKIENYLELPIKEITIASQENNLPADYPEKKDSEMSDINVEIVRNNFPEYVKHRIYNNLNKFSGDRFKEHQYKPKFHEVSNNDEPQSSYLKQRQNSLFYYKIPKQYYEPKKEKIESTHNVYLQQDSNGHWTEVKSPQYFSREPVRQQLNELFRNLDEKNPKRTNRLQQNLSFRKFSRYRYAPMTECDNSYNARFLGPRNSRRNENPESQFQDKFYPKASLRRHDNFPAEIRLQADRKNLEETIHNSIRGKIRSRRATRYLFEPAKGFFSSEIEAFGGEDFNKLKNTKIVHKLEKCIPKTELVENLKDSKEKEQPALFISEIISSLQKLQNKISGPAKREDKDLKKKKNSDKDRLILSYLTAPDYVLEDMRKDFEKKKMMEEEKTEDTSKENQSYNKKVSSSKEEEKAELSEKNQNSNSEENYARDEGKVEKGEKERNQFCNKNGGTADTAHCMRFGDMWYSLYMIKKPVVAQIVGVQMFDKHSLCDGTTQWRDLTKGKMIRIGTFLPKAEDELPSLSVTFAGGKAKKMENAIDPDNYLLLVPSHVSDPTRTNYYPQFDGGPAEYMLVNSKDVSDGGECNSIGTSFEAFSRQVKRCSQRKGSCLERQPVDLWREDMEARIRGKRGKYFVENFGTISNSPVKTYTNYSGEFLALEYYGDYTSTIEIEVKADYNAVVRKGSNAQIPSVYIDSTYPKKTRIILSVLNIGLTSAYFRPRLGDCSPDLDPAWCPLEGPLVVIPPQQRHDFKLDLSGSLPIHKIHANVQVLNQLNKKIAYRKVEFKKGTRCVCAFHCKCNCIGDLTEGRVCHKLGLEEYRGAGYTGAFPFRGGSPTATETVSKNIHVIFLTAIYVLLLLGIIKGMIGIFYRRLGIAGTKIIVGSRPIEGYYENELQCCTVIFDEYGFPIHPTNYTPVQIVPLWVEVIINIFFFFIYPLRGLFLLISSLPCFNPESGEYEETFQQEIDPNSMHPLLSKFPQPNTNVQYNLTTLKTVKGKAEKYLPYLRYKGDDDPLEEDDTEFVLQEMQRYRKRKNRDYLITKN